MKKLLVFMLLVVMIFSNDAIVFAKDKIYVNDIGVEFSSKDLKHLEKLEITRMEINLMSQDEKIKYLSFIDKNISKKSYFLKTKKIKKDGGEYTYEEEVITEEEAVELRSSSSIFLVIDDGGGGGGSINWGDTYEANDPTDISVRKLTIVSVYNYTYDQMFVKATVEWYVMPSDRGWDLIGIGYTSNFWYIETTNTYNPSTGSYIQTANFSGKQLYDWEQFDYQYSNPVIGTETKSFTYNESNIGYYTPDYTNGIVLKQNLKNNEIEYRPTTYGVQAYGYRVTDLVLTLEANIDTVGNNSFGIFKASSLHQESYTTINIGDCSFTPTPPFISVPLGIFQWGRKYEDNGLNVSINVPID